MGGYIVTKRVEHEWEGEAAGLSNLSTKARAHASAQDCNVSDAALPRLLASARLVMQGPDNHIHDAVIHGVRVRLFTNSFHLSDFFTQSFAGPREWSGWTGVDAPAQPEISAYAYLAAEDQPESAHYHASSRTILIFNNAFFGQVRDWVLGAVARLLAEERGILFAPAGAVARGDHAALLLPDDGTAAFAAMREPDARLIGAAGAFVRFAFSTKQGRWVSPVCAGEARGWRVFRWLETHPGETDAPVRAITLDDRVHDLKLKDFDLSAPPRAFAFPADRRAYVPTTAVRDPGVLKRARLENGTTPAARALLDPVEVFGRPRSCPGPLDSAHIAGVLVSGGARGPHGRNQYGRRLLELLPGRADRLADAAAETAHARAMLAKSDPFESHQEAVRAAVPVPATLAADLELHRTLSRCARTLDGGPDHLMEALG